MPAIDPFQSRSKWRVLLPVTAAGAVGFLLTLMGVVRTPDGGLSSEELRVAVLQDHFRLQHAAIEYVRDTHALPAPSFDISEGTPSALSDARLVPLAQQDGWHGPYLVPGLDRPTKASFWSLADAGALGPAETGAAWGRLHRGYGEIDDETSQYIDQVLDDGDGATGSVRLTDTWIWFKLVELPAETLAASSLR